MADNVAITSGVGTPISTDDIAGVHYQRVKLTDGAADSATPILAGGGTEAGALRVTLASDSTGVVSVDDNGGALTVDGTVTANLSATDNQVLDEILTSLQTIDNPVEILGTGIYVEAATAAVVVGAVRRDANTTLVNLTNEIAPLQVNPTGELKVAQIQALPAGTNNIGDVDVLSIAAGDNNIGNVDIASVPAPLSTTGNGTAATAQRVTLASDSTGQVVLAAGSAAIGKLATNTGVDIGNVGVVGVVPSAGATNLGKAEDAAHASGDVGVMMLAVRRDTAVHGVSTDGDYATLNVDANGRLHVNASGAAIPITDNSGSLTVDGSVSLAAAIPAGTNNIGDVDVLSVPAPLSTAGNGTAATALRVTLASDSTGQVALAAGSAAIGKLAANSGVDIGDVDILSIVPGVGATNLGKAEDAAHTSGDVGVQVLAVRKDTAAALAGTDGDYASLEVDANGRLHVLNLQLERTITIVTGTAASSGDNSLIAAPGASVKIVVCGFIIQNESTSATTMILRDGTTSKIRCYAKNQGDGLSQVFTSDARWKLTANTALNLNLSGANSCGYTIWYYTE